MGLGSQGLSHRAFHTGPLMGVMSLRLSQGLSHRAHHMRLITVLHTFFTQDTTYVTTLRSYIREATRHGSEECLELVIVTLLHIPNTVFDKKLSAVLILQSNTLIT